MYFGVIFQGGQDGGTAEGFSVKADPDVRTEPFSGIIENRQKAFDLADAVTAGNGRVFSMPAFIEHDAVKTELVIEWCIFHHAVARIGITVSQDHITIRVCLRAQTGNVVQIAVGTRDGIVLQVRFLKSAAARGMILLPDPGFVHGLTPPVHGIGCNKKRRDQEQHNDNDDGNDNEDHGSPPASHHTIFFGKQESL